MSVKIQLDALDLFGNDAAEDEEEDIFQSYALEREETRIFTDPLRRLCVVRAYKGEGKSALLRLAASRVGWSDSKMMLIRGIRCLGASRLALRTSCFIPSPRSARAGSWNSAR